MTNLIVQVLHALEADPVDPWEWTLSEAELRAKLQEMARQAGTADEFMLQWFYNPLAKRFAGRKMSARMAAQELTEAVDFYIVEIRGYRFAAANPLPGIEGTTLLLQGKEILEAVLQNEEITQDAITLFSDPNFNLMMKGVMIQE